MVKAFKKLGKILAVLLAVIMVASLFEVVPVKAADKEFKVVYTVKQLKKAMKAKGAKSIVFRTQTYDDITIPSVKAAKNKAIYIAAPHSDVKNKSKFSYVEILEVNSFAEAVSGNTIVWNSYNTDGLIVEKGKTVNKLTFKKFTGLEPSYILRKGAKVKSLSLMAYGKVSKTDTKKRTVTIDTYDPYAEISGMEAKATYTLDKSGRITSGELKNLEDDITYTYKYKYDKNGNLIESKFDQTGDITTVSVYKYDSKNNLIELSVTGHSNPDYDFTVFYEYNSDGKTTHSYYLTEDGSPDTYECVYTYDKKGRCLKSDYPNSDFNITYKYDSAGRRIEEVDYDGSEGIFRSCTYQYDKNGLLSESKDNYYADRTGLSQAYSYDYLGNNIFVVNQYIDEDGYSEPNEGRYEFYMNEFVGDTPRYEDGFVSPVGDEEYVMDAYIEKGYTVVQNIEQLLDAIAPGAKIILPPCYLNMSDYIENLGKDVSKYVTIEYNGIDGKQLVIHDCDDLMISGGPSSYYSNSSELVIDPRYSSVIKFENCNNLKLNALTLGHTWSSECEGNVLDFYNCKDVSLYGVDLYGCGVYGIGTYKKTKNVSVYNSLIHDCSDGIFDISSQAGKITFTNCMFYGSEGGGFINGMFEGKVIFKKCTFGENETNALYFRTDITCEDCFWSEVTTYPDYPDY